jgi:hypothetical protein
MLIDVFQTNPWIVFSTPTLIQITQFSDLEIGIPADVTNLNKMSLHPTSGVSNSDLPNSLISISFIYLCD